MAETYEPIGFCPACGYKMDAGTCPECGKYAEVPSADDPTRPRPSHWLSLLLKYAIISIVILVVVGLTFLLTIMVTLSGGTWD